MLFDNRTLFVAFFCVSLTMTLALAAIWRVQPASRGLALMSGGNAASTVAGLLVSLRHVVPDLITVFLANFLFIGGLILVTEAFRALCAVPERRRLDAAFLAAGCAAVLYFLYVEPSVLARVIVLSVTYAVLSSFAAADLFRVGRRGAIAAAAQLALFGALMAARAILSPMAGDVPSLMTTTHPVHTLAIMLGIVTSISFNLTFLWTVFAEADFELRRANAELKRSNAELDRFAAVVSHDLKAPLNTLTGYLGLVREAFTGHENTRNLGFLTSAEDGAWRMNALIDEILTYSRFRQTPDNRGPVDLGAVGTTAIANLKSRIEESGATIELASLPTVTGDQAQFVRLLQNLIDNAIKYRSPSRPCHIHIAAARDHRAWKVAVTDNGIGIAPSDCHRVFETFRRVDDGADVEGVGLGLGICRQIVERHGGRIWVESEPGKGSTFFFTIPV